MSIRKNLVGKTISGVVAVQDHESEPATIWMLQFSDGSHVEFVSPTAKRRLRTAAGTKRMVSTKRISDAQLVLNVA